MQVLKVRYQDLSSPFIEYDTVFGSGMHYPLPQTDLILLIFLAGGTGQVFTTIRRYESEKWNYYAGLQGMIFEVVITDETDN
jgi:hypothetical protein